MSVTVGPYVFERARFYAWRDELNLDNSDGDLAVCEYDTGDGDRWFSRLDEPDKITGIEIEFVSERLERGLTVELPSGERVLVEGIKESVDSDHQV